MQQQSFSSRAMHVYSNGLFFCQFMESSVKLDKTNGKASRITKEKLNLVQIVFESKPLLFIVCYVLVSF